MQPAIASRIVDAAAITQGDSIVEIGPGLGALTGLILQRDPRSLTLIELDQSLAAQLQSRFAQDPRVTLINADFLHLQSARFASVENLKIIGNLPFNVAAAILERLCGYRATIARMVLMFQREVAERIRARPHDRDYGALSVFTALYWHVVEHFRVAAGNFYPRPKIDAEVLVFVPRKDLHFDTTDEARIVATVRAAFSAPRKTIQNSLAAGLSAAADQVRAALVDAAIDPTARPALLGVADFLKLAHALDQLKLLPQSDDA